MIRFYSLMKEIYDPFLHIYFALNWSVAFFLLWRGEAFSSQDFSTYWPVILVDVIILFFVLFYLRLVDEIKDYDYDLIFNPDRPLVTGKASVQTFVWTSLACLTVSLLLASYLGPYALVFIILHFIYSFLLWPLELGLPWLRRSMILNLLVTYPVNVALTLFLLMSFSIGPQERWGFTSRDLLCVLIFASSFLYYEFSRKIDFKAYNSHKDQRLYSNELGLKASIALNLLWASIAVLGLYLVLDTWFSFLLFIPVLWGSLRLREKKAFPFKVTGGVFLGLFYAFIMSVQLIRAF